MADLAMRPLSLGEQLDRAFTVYRSRFGALLLAVIICMALPILMIANNLDLFTEFAQASQGGASQEEAMRLAFRLFGKFAMIGLVAAAGFIVARATLGWITHKALLGDEVGAIEGLEMGVRFFLPMLGLFFLEGAIYMVAMVVMYIPMIFLVAGSVVAGGASAGPGVAAFVWVFAFVAVMWWLLAAMFVTSSVLLAESDATVFRAIERSWNLTKGRRLGIFGGILVVVVLAFVVQFGLAFGAGILMGATAGTGTPQVGMMMVVFFGLNALANLLVTGYYYVFQMVVYYDLRVRKEGLDLELASEAMAST